MKYEKEATTQNGRRTWKIIYELVRGPEPKKVGKRKTSTRPASAAERKKTKTPASETSKKKKAARSTSRKPKRMVKGNDNQLRLI